ncbi:DUF3280 domain-containing protein [Hyphomicrobium sp.]|uniref:DUF3280 domain-containing protein n=1 Tax=Hyphomicrobium sp. TaxID=82 RepID=UPI0022BCAE9D|nr:DUF3280 domain-containing protein [Hyphomicrobium sp.]MCZ7595172.1 DUF3280 domain-containing protein [Hyphomicrobium sp.]
MIAKRFVIFLLALALSPAAVLAGQKAIIFPFDLIDQQQQFEIGLMPKGLDPEDKRRLEIITDELTKLVRDSGRYEVVDRTPIAKDIEDKSPMYKCNGCEDDLAKKVGADIAFIGTVRKASDVLFTVSIYVRDVANQKVIHQGSSEIYGNTDKMWLRAVNYIVDRRLYADRGAK